MIVNTGELLTVDVRLNGKPIARHDVLKLLRLFGWDGIHADLTGRGYRLLPVRAPKQTRRAFVTFRFCWKVPGENCVNTIRMAREWPTR